MSRFVCIHGHFYQPPRENPWLGAVEIQDSAHPYHDWNERVCAECYAPNAASRILDPAGRIEAIVNNYAQISFDFGPTLLSWLEAHEPAVYAAVLDADRRSRERFGGHGSALVQPYNHMILPLASRRDKQTQIRWGLYDFERRFGRPAEGAWLPETAVDVETLELLAGFGVRFTVLEPHQARRVRPLAAAAFGAAPPGGAPRAAGAPGTAGAPGASDPKESGWRDVSPEVSEAAHAISAMDTTCPYLVGLPSGAVIAVFFFDAPIARAVAFEKLLASGEALAERLLAAFPAGAVGDRLVHIATDGETYGHHHKHGEMALSYALHRIETSGGARVTNYGEYLAAHPPDQEVEIVSGSSWSCVHGVDRWREDCGCRTGGEPGWNQAWRAPLRAALDELRDELAPLWEAAAGEIFAAPWAARDAYVELVLDRSPERAAAFLARHARPAPAALDGRPLAAAEQVRALKLLELQRHAMLMYTSCGWFFSDLAGIETVQILRYAGRVAELAGELFGASAEGSRFEQALLRRLAWARGNDPQQGSGRELYEARVRPAMAGAPEVAAHYALSSLFCDYPNPAEIHDFTVECEHGRMRRSGHARLAVGRVRVISRLTGAVDRLCFGVLHFGDPHLTAGVRALAEGDGNAPGAGPEAVDEGGRTGDFYERMVEEVEEAFTSGKLAQAVRLLDRYFGHRHYSLESLFRDEQRRILDQILAATTEEVEAELREVVRHHAPVMRFVSRLGSPQPAAYRAAADTIVNADLCRALADPAADPGELRRLLDEAAELDVQLDARLLGFTAERTLLALLERLHAEPEAPGLLASAAGRIGLARDSPFPIDLWRCQNLAHALRETVYPARRAAAAAGDPAARTWVDLFHLLAEGLSLRVSPPG